MKNSFYFLMRKKNFWKSFFAYWELFAIRFYRVSKNIKNLILKDFRKFLCEIAQNPCYDYVFGIFCVILCVWQKPKNPVIPRAYNQNLARTAPFLTLNRKTAVIFCTIYQYLARTMPLKPIYRKNFVWYRPNPCKNFIFLDMVL